MNKILSILSLLGICCVHGCSNTEVKQSYDSKWKEEPGIMREVLNADSITNDGITIVPVVCHDARLVIKEGPSYSEVMLINAKGYEFFYLVTKNETKKSKMAYCSVRVKRTDKGKNNESSEVELEYKHALYPSSKVVIGSYVPLKSTNLSDEYVKLQSASDHR